MSQGSRWVYFEIQVFGYGFDNVVARAHRYLKSWLKKPSRKLKRFTVSVVDPYAPAHRKAIVVVRTKTAKNLETLFEVKVPPFIRVYEESDMEKLAHSLEKTNAGN